MKIEASMFLVAALATAAVARAEPKSAGPAGGRVYELRTYTASPGRLDALNARFREHTVALFKKHGMEVVAFWEPVDKEAGAGEKLVYLLAFPSRAAAEASWKEFRADPEWIRVKAESEVGGVLAAHIDSVFLSPTDYSPLK